MQAGIEKLAKLKVLFMSNNKVKDWSEVDRLVACESLEDLLLVGNPIYNEYKDNNATADYRIEVCGGGKMWAQILLASTRALHAFVPAGLR